MSNCKEKYDEDEEYLYDRMEKIGRKPSENLIEWFCERVSIVINDCLMTEDQARRIAFNELINNEYK